MANLVKKWVLRSISALLMGLLLLVVLTPTLLSTERGKRFVIQLAESQAGITLTIDELSFSWFGNQVLTGVTFDDNKEIRFGFDHLVSQCKFLNILLRSGTIEETSVENFWVLLKAEPPTKKTDTHESPLKESHPSRPFWADYCGKLTLKNGKIEVHTKGRSLISIEDIFFEWDKPKSYLNNSSLVTRGITKQGALKGSFDVNAELHEWIEGKAKVTNFPLQGIDQIVTLFQPKYEGLLLAALGDTFNLDLETRSSRINFHMRSPQLLLEMSSNYQNSFLELIDEGHISCTITPQVFNTFSKELKLEKEAEIKMALKSAFLPLNNSKLLFKELSAKGKLHFKGGNFYIETFKETIPVDALSLSFQTEELKKQLNLFLETTFQNATLKGSLDIASPLEATPLFSQFDVLIDRFPISWIDQINSSNLKAFLGDTLNLTLHKSQKEFSFSAETPLFNFPEATFTLSDRAHLIKPTTFTYLLPTSLYEHLAHPVPLNGVLSGFSVPIKDNQLDISEIHFDLLAKAKNTNLKNLLSSDEIELPFINIAVQASSLKDIQFNGSSRLNFSKSPWGSSLFGSQIEMKSSGKIKWKGQLEVPTFIAEFEGEKLKTVVDASIKKNTLILQKPLKVHLHIAPEQVNPILSQQNHYLRLNKDASLFLELSPTHFSLEHMDFSSITLKGSGKSPLLSFNVPADNFPIGLQNAEIHFDIDGVSKKSAFDFKATATSGENVAGKVALKVDTIGVPFDLEQTPENVEFTFTNFSTKIADAFLKGKGMLPDAIGSQFDLSCQLASKEEKKAIDLKIESPLLSVDSAFTLDESLSLQTPLKARWRLSQKAYDTIMEDSQYTPPFTIQDGGELSLHIPSLMIPINQSDISLVDASFEGQFHLDNLPLESKDQEIKAALETLNFNVAKSKTNTIDFHFDGNVHSTKEKSRGEVRGKGTVANFLSENGTFDLSQISTLCQTTIQDLPSDFLDIFFKLHPSEDYLPSTFLGSSVNASLKANIEKSYGTIDININAAACKASLSSIISNSNLYLKSPLQASFKVTPQLNALLEQKANLTIIEMEKPILLTIEESGFFLPLHGLSMEKMHFKHGRLDLGKVICKNTGNASIVSTLFKKSGSPNTSFWFAPADCHMKKGKLYIDRTEILYDQSLQVCLWGKVNFPSHYVSMTLGLTRQALNSALGISNIPSDYVLKVPVKGPFENVTIDAPAAAGKIALLVAGKQKALKKGLWGHVMGAIGDLADDQSDVPPPKPPFPWEKGNG